MNHPEELIAQLRMLGRLEEFGSRRALRAPLPGRRRRGAHPLAPAPHAASCAALKADVLPQLPAKRQVVVPVALDNEREYRLAEQDVIAWLREQPLDLARARGARSPPRCAPSGSRSSTRCSGWPRAASSAPALAWIDDFLASDEPLVVFAGHREVQDLLLERFPDALHLLGRDSDRSAREDAVQAFQAPGGPQLIVCATRVGGQGITLTRASNVAFLDLEWTPGDARPGRGPLPPHRPATTP